MATETPPRTGDNYGDDDELDDILNGTLNGKDIFDTSDIQPQVEPQRPKKTADTTDLGLDKEIEVTKNRRPIPKLDDNLLLSDPGIPKLRKISKDRLRFKGKGHEYGDIARMLNMYQLWLDDLYPRAKFADALTMIEKLGHTKRVQYMRKEWIDEAKPKRTVDRDEDEDVPDEPPRQGEEQMEGVISGPTQDATADKAADNHTQGNQDRETMADDGNPDEDELDMLLAESELANVAATPSSNTAMQSKPTPAVDDPFADDIEAMAEMEDMW